MKNVRMAVSDEMSTGELNRDHKVFAYMNGVLAGMVLLERDSSTREKGYIVRFPDGCGCSGYSASVRGCVEKSMKRGYTFKVVEE